MSNPVIILFVDEGHEHISKQTDRQTNTGENIIAIFGNKDDRTKGKSVESYIFHRSSIEKATECRGI